MDDNRIRPVTPSPARLKYEPNRNNNSQKKKREKKDSHEPDADNEHVIDDFA
ncbi:MAG: hypothetical protein R8G33_01765 [Gammaproteobacteria bacterium]|nr:hypothetical protein [Gammaproteobacteria bacterium]